MAWLLNVPLDTGIDGADESVEYRHAGGITVSHLKSF